MRQIFGLWYGIFLLAALFLTCLARVNEGALLILSFEGDAVHMAQIVMRMVAGDVPHLDFLTPLGAMAFLPIVWLVELGFPLGTAFGYAPVLIGIFCLPAIYWVGVSRFSPSGAMAFAAVVLIQLMALVHGGTEPTVAVSMYYNNWSWAVSSIVVALSLLQSKRDGRVGRRLDPAFIGIGLGFLLLTKATYAVYLLPAIVLALLVRKQYAVLGFGVIWALVFLALVTVPLGGIDYWQGYVADLRFVAGSSVRAQPGGSLALMVLEPLQLTGLIGIIAAFVLFRQAKFAVEALIILVLGVGWILVTHQNWQNDPHWLIIGGLVVAQLSENVTLYNRFGWPVKRALGVIVVGFLVLGLPLFLTQAQSLLIHSSLRAATFENALVGEWVKRIGFRNVTEGRFLVQHPNQALGSLTAKPTVLNGEVLPDCQKETGLIAELVASGKALDRRPELANKSVLYADWNNGLWLFSNTEPLKGGAPWYYGGKPGFSNADYLVVPMCPMGLGVRRIILEEITQDADLAFVEVLRTPLFILLKRE